MPRRVVYGISLWVFLASAACTIASIALPSWLTYTAPTASTPTISLGLHKRCSSLTEICAPFPRDEDCYGDDRAFCSMWRSTGFLMNFAVIMELVCVVAYITILVGGRSSREAGWKILSGLLGLVGVGQMVGMALVAYLYEHDRRFSFPGWHLDKAWILCTVSWTVLVVNALGVTSAALLMPSEDDYEPIPDPR